MIVLRTPEIWCSSSAHLPLRTVVWLGAPYWNFKFISSSLSARAAVPHQKYIWVQGWCRVKCGEKCGESPRNLYTRTHLERVQKHALRSAGVYQLQRSGHGN